MKYVQRTGQGVDIIFREMVSSVKPYPQYHVYNEAVALTIFSAIDDVNFVKFIASEQDKIQKRRIKDKNERKFYEIEAYLLSMATYWLQKF